VNVSVYLYLLKQIPDFHLLLKNIIFKAFLWHIYNACYKCNNLRTTDRMSMYFDIGYVMKNFQVSLIIHVDLTVIMVTLYDPLSISA